MKRIVNELFRRLLQTALLSSALLGTMAGVGILAFQEVPSGSFLRDLGLLCTGIGALTVGVIALRRSAVPEEPCANPAPAYRAEPTSPDVDLEFPRKTGNNPFVQTDCWFCGSDDAFSHTYEYGWYEEAYSSSDTGNFKTEHLENVYIPIGRHSVHVCEGCIAAYVIKIRNERKAWMWWLGLLGFLGTTVSGAFFGWLDYVPGLWHFYDLVRDDFSFENRNQILLDVFMVGLAFVSYLMLLVPGLIFVFWVFHMLIVRPFNWLLGGKEQSSIHDENYEEERREFGLDWVRDAGSEALMRENADRDPIFIFHPNARVENDSHLHFNPKTGWYRESKGIAYTHYIGHRRPEVNGWDPRPPQPRII